MERKNNKREVKERQIKELKREGHRDRQRYVERVKENDNQRTEYGNQVEKMREIKKEEEEED